MYVKLVLLKLEITRYSACTSTKARTDGVFAYWYTDYMVLYSTLRSNNSQKQPRFVKWRHRRRSAVGWVVTTVLFLTVY